MTEVRRPMSKVTASTKRTIQALVPALLRWFARNARDLPWRRTRDPYAIWISEIMLQQTQVKTVIPYWERWMRELPDVRALARAKPERVLKLWEGLGYYTRARNVQRAAQVIVARHSGRFPEAFDDMLSLPGIGRYTAGAIGSIAFDQPAPILDGNVIRVLTRLIGIRQNPREKATNDRLWALAGELVAHAARKRSAINPSHLSPLTSHLAGPCSALNQSLMELGATICTPRQPQCSLCPVRSHCLARKHGLVDKLPNLNRLAPATRRRCVVIVVHHRGRWLARQRPNGVVNGQLWEFPNAESPSDAGDLQLLAASLAGVPVARLSPLCQIKHTITRHRITLDVFRAERTTKPGRPERHGRWCTLAELNDLAWPSAHRKILQQLAQDGR